MTATTTFKSVLGTKDGVAQGLRDSLGLGKRSASPPSAETDTAVGSLETVAQNPQVTTVPESWGSPGCPSQPGLLSGQPWWH